MTDKINDNKDEDIRPCIEYMHVLLTMKHLWNRAFHIILHKMNRDMQAELKIKIKNIKQKIKLIRNNIQQFSKNRND